MAEIVNTEAAPVPEPLNPEEYLTSGFGEHVFTTTFYCREKIQAIVPKAGSMAEPTIYGLFFRDPRVVHGEQKIRNETKEAKGWFPIECNVSISDMQCEVQEPLAAGVSHTRDVDKVSILVKQTNDSRAVLKPIYSLNRCKPDLLNEYEMYANARENTDERVPTTGVLAKLNPKNLVQGRFCKRDAEGNLKFEEFYQNFNSRDWVEMFNKEETNVFNYQWMTSERFMRPMETLWQPVRQCIKFPVQVPKLLNGQYLTTPHKEEWEECQAKAYVIYPFDNCDGLLTHSNLEVDGWEENYDSKSGKRRKIGQNAVDALYINAERNDKNYYTYKPINNYPDMTSENFQYIPSNLGLEHKLTNYHYLSKQDRANYLKAKGLYEMNDWNQPTQWPSQNRTRRYYPSSQAFSSEKGMGEVYFQFLPKYNGDAGIRNIYVTFKYTVSHKIGIYYINPDLTRRQIRRMDDVNLTNINVDMMGDSCYRKLEMCDVLDSNKTITVSNGSIRWYLPKPQVHYVAAKYVKKE